MLFNSFSFIFIFFPVVFIISKQLKGQKLLFWISLSSFIFYAKAGHAWFVIPMAITTLLDFFIGIEIEKTKLQYKKKFLLMISLWGNLGLLFYFKYSAFLLKSVVWVISASSSANTLKALHLFDVVLPAGISFYTFQTLSYIIDVYRGTCHAEKSILNFISFVTFFPHLVAGPLTRHDQLIPQLEKIANEKINPRYEEGIYLFCVGLCKKILIADRIASIIDPIISNIHSQNLSGSWLAILGFTFQIYFDFSGYSDMAIGLGRLFGIELPQNFNSPYKSISPTDFWKRWHMSLSSWLKDYLYISLGGNRCSPLRKNFNLIMTMFLGLYHGCLLVLCHRYEQSFEKLPTLIRRAITFFAVCIGWIFFRADSLHQAMIWLRNCLFFNISSVNNSVIGTHNYFLIFLILCSLIITMFFNNASSFENFKKLNKMHQFALGLMTTLALLLVSSSSKFLYFQF